MFLEIILAIIITRSLRKIPQTPVVFDNWDKPLAVAFYVSIGMLVLQGSVSAARPILDWLIYGLLFWLAYITFYRSEFSSAKPMMYSFLPFIVVSFAGAIIKLISRD